jgi:Peptidase M50B-like
MSLLRNFLIAPMVGALLLPLSWYALGFAAHQWRWPPPDDGALVIGVLLALTLLAWRKPHYLLHTWLHESAHALMCLALGVRVRSFSASDGQGGAVGHAPTGPIRTTLILIAPYVLPLLAAPVLLARYLCDAGTTRMTLTAASGFFLVLHAHDLWLNIRLNAFGSHADIPRIGHILALVLILSGMGLLAASALFVLSSTQPPQWWQMGWQSGWQTLTK